MRRQIIIYILLTTILGIGQCEDSPIPLEVVFVTGNSDGREMLQLDPNASPWQTEKIELSLQETQNLSLRDLLERQNSIQLRSTGGRASYSSLSIRGSSSSQVKIFIDDMEVNNGQNAQVDLSKYSLQQFERIEIYRSHAPSRFGISPLGGVINLITRQKKEQNINLKLGTASFGFFEGLLDAQFKTPQLSHHIQIEHQQEKGNFSYTDDNQTPDNPLDDKEKIRSNNDFKSYNAIWGGKYQSNDQQLDWNTTFYQRDKGLPGTAKFQTQAVRYKETQQQFKLGFHQANIFTNHGYSHVTLSLMNETDQYLDPNAEMGTGGSQDNEYHALLWEFSAIQQEAHRYFNNTYSIKFRNESFGSEDKQLQQSFPKSQRQHFDLGLETQIPLFSNRLEATLSWENTFIDNQLKLNNSNGNAPLAGYDHFSTWNTGLLWHLSSTLNLRTGFSEALRMPSIGELYGDRGATVGNDQLQAEKATHFDIGLEWNSQREWGPFSESIVKLSFFHLERQNLMAMVINPTTGVGRSENLGDGQVEGIEIHQSIHIGKHISLIQNFTWMDAMVQSPFIAAGAEKVIPGIYEFSWSPQINLFWGPWSASYNISVEQNMFYDSANFFEAADKELHHLSLKWSKAPYNIAFDIDNLTDEQVEDFNNWPRPGRSYSFSFMTSF